MIGIAINKSVYIIIIKLVQTHPPPNCIHIFHIVLLHVNLTTKANKATNLRALFSISIEKRLLRWDSNPQPPAFKAVALPTEPPRQPSWLGSNSNHTSYASKMSCTCRLK